MGNLVPAFQSPSHTAHWLDKLKPQMQLALPKHLNVERMTRLVLTAFSNSPALAECSPHSVASSIMTAAQLGLEPGINGQGWLIPYKQTCTFVPGWKGLVDLAQRGGRCTVWAQPVFRGDEFDFMLGDNPYVRHRPGDGVAENYDSLTHVYAIGRIKGQDVPVIEVWSRARVERHLATFNKVGGKHYALKDDRKNFVPYARKIPLLRVLQYMPQSIELTAAMEASHAADEGRTINIDGATWIPTVNPDDNAPDGPVDTPAPSPAPASGPAPQTTMQGAQAASDNGKPAITDEALAKKKASCMKAFAAGQTVNEVVTALETMNSLSLDQRMEVAAWAEAGQQQQPQGDAK